MTRCCWSLRNSLLLLQFSALLFAVSDGCVSQCFSEEDFTTEVNISVRTDAVIKQPWVSTAIRVEHRMRSYRLNLPWYETTADYIDNVHLYTSNAVNYVAGSLDGELDVFVADALDENITNKKEGDISERMSDYFNKFFRESAYLYGDNDSYLLLRLGVEGNMLANTVTHLTDIKLSIQLPHSQNRLHLFVGDPFKSKEEERVLNDQGEVNSQTAVGAAYFLPELIEDLNMNIFGGFRGLTNPFVQGRAEYPFNVYDWLIRPVQSVEYSVSRQFYEQSQLYFDRRISPTEMVRLLLMRQTETEVAGMNYQGILGYYLSFSTHAGFSVSATASGTTQVDTERYVGSEADPHSGIYLYSLGVVWKESFWRKWLFYEVAPQVAWDMLYTWQPNYIVDFNIEIYFGGIE